MATGRVNVGGGSSGLNVFTQLTEPSTKEGIWLQTSESYKKVVNDRELFFANAWIDPAYNMFADVPNTQYYTTTTVVGLKVYVLKSSRGDVNTIKNLYEYDTVKNTWTELAPPPFQAEATSIVAIGEKIHAVGGMSRTSATIYNAKGFHFVYDTSSNIWTELPMLPMGILRATVATANGKIYVMGGDSSDGGGIEKRCSVYNPANQTWSTLGTLPSTYNSKVPKAIVISGDIYIFYNNYQFYKYTIESNTWTLEGSSPTLIYQATMTSVGEKIYLIGVGQTRIGIFDTVTKIYKDDALIPGVFTGESISIEFVNGMIYTFGSTFNGIKGKVLGYSFRTKSFDNLSFVLFRNHENKGSFYTELISPSKRLAGMEPLRITSGFNNAWLFKDGDLQEYPSYYGDGEKWIKFKN